MSCPACYFLLSSFLTSCDFFSPAPRQLLLGPKPQFNHVSGIDCDKIPSHILQRLLSQVRQQPGNQTFGTRSLKRNQHEGFHWMFLFNKFFLTDRNINMINCTPSPSVFLQPSLQSEPSRLCSDSIMVLSPYSSCSELLRVES